MRRRGAVDSGEGCEGRGASLGEGRMGQGPEWGGAARTKGRGHAY